jgi:hypothetical protein
MRINRLSNRLVAGACVALVGCGGSTLTVQVLAEGAEGPVPQSNIEVSMYPFDRDSVFDLLDAQAEVPRPAISADMQATFEESQRLGEEWRGREADWAEARDRLQRLSEQLERMDRRDPQYRRRFDEWNNIDREQSRLDRERKDLFEQYTEVQETINASIDSFKIVRDAWENEAYAGYFDMRDQLLAELGTEIFRDTTNSDGYVTRKLPGGDWWVTTRIRVSGGEIVWNLEIDPSQVDTLRLNSENGEERVRF